MSMLKHSLKRGLMRPASIVMCTLALSLTPAHAAFVSYSFTGMTDAQNPGDSLPVLGSFQFNKATDGNGGVYNGAVTNFRVTIGTYTSSFSPGINGVTISQGTTLGGGLSGDRWTLVSAATGSELSGTVPYNFDIHLDRNGGGLFTNTALQDPPSFESLTQARWRLFFQDEHGAPFASIGSITSLTAVPLPPAAILFGVGLIALVGLGVGGLRNLRDSQT